MQFLLKLVKVTGIGAIRIPMLEGSSPARASPVMIAGAYSVRPKPAAKAKAAFWLSPFATAVITTIANVNTK